MATATTEQMREVVVLLRWSLWNTQQVVTSEFHRERDAARVARMRNEAYMQTLVIKHLEEGTEPNTPASKIWKRWFVAWAVLMIQHYNRDDLEYMQATCARLRAERDRDLRQCGWLVN